MKCVGYDKDFQRALANMPPDYVSPNDTKKKVTSKGRKRKSGSEELNGTSRKRRKIKAPPASTNKQNREASEKTVSQAGRPKKTAASVETVTKRKRVVRDRNQS
jgi:hypothetical protein